MDVQVLWQSTNRADTKEDNIFHGSYNGLQKCTILVSISKMLKLKGLRITFSDLILHNGTDANDAIPQEFVFSRT